MEQNQNALAAESDGDSTHGSLAVTAHPAADYAEYDSATGTFVTRRRAPRPPEVAAPPAPLALLAEPEPAHPAEPAEFEPIPLRARLDGWTPARQRQFLEELAECGIVKEAAGRVGMSPKSAWQLRRRAEGTSFGYAFEAALADGLRQLHSAAFERAVEGVARPIYYHGEKVGEQRVFDNRLLLALLGKAGAPFDPRRTQEVRRNWEGWLDAVERGLDEPPFDLSRAEGNDGHVWLDEDGTFLTDFPPPEGAEVEEDGIWGDGDYSRSLTADELAVVEAARAEERARAEAERDAFFRR
jgi:hypothetical protein